MIVSFVLLLEKSCILIDFLYIYFATGESGMDFIVNLPVKSMVFFVVICKKLDVCEKLTKVFKNSKIILS